MVEVGLLYHSNTQGLTGSAWSWHACSKGQASSEQLQGYRAGAEVHVGIIATEVWLGNLCMALTALNKTFKSLTTELVAKCKEPSQLQAAWTARASCQKKLRGTYQLHVMSVVYHVRPDIGCYPCAEHLWHDVGAS